MPLSPGQTLSNRYRIVQLLGQGGFGAVYRAWDINLRRACALKENLDTSPEAQRQFEREAVILANLRHPSLPAVNDHFVIPGQGQYLVMEYVEGEDLQEMLQRIGGPLPEGQALAWIGQICDALEYLHAQRPPIIHRDVKPANIKITGAGAASPGKAMLVDFGIAKIYDPHLNTTLGARAVTPGYSPLEQYGMGATDARTDVYALGATLYHMLTGQKPPESVQRNIQDTLAPPRMLNPNISAGTEAAVLSAMQPHPSRRFQSVAAFNQTLRSPKIPPQASSTVVAPSPGAAGVASTVAVGTLPTGRALASSLPWGWIILVAALGLVIAVLLGLVLSGGDDRSATQTALAALTLTQDALATNPHPDPILSKTTTPLAATPSQTSPPPTLASLTENFDNANEFTLTQPERVYIDGGQVFWDVSRSGGEQYAYRSIPAFQGDIELTVSGRVDYASNNCGIQAGVGDEELAGISITYGFFGGGCPTKGYVIGAGGVSLDHMESSCTFTGTWLWINKGKQYTATLTLDGPDVILSVPGIGSVSGQRVYEGLFTILYVGLNGKGDWPECNGTIDSIGIKQLR